MKQKMLTADDRVPGLLQYTLREAVELNLVKLLSKTVQTKTLSIISKFFVETNQMCYRSPIRAEAFWQLIDIQNKRLFK